MNETSLCLFRNTSNIIHMNLPIIYYPKIYENFLASIHKVDLSYQSVISLGGELHVFNFKSDSKRREKLQLCESLKIKEMFQTSVQPILTSSENERHYFVPFFYV